MEYNAETLRLFIGLDNGTISVSNDCSNHENKTVFNKFKDISSCVNAAKHYLYYWILDEDYLINIYSIHLF